MTIPGLFDRAVETHHRETALRYWSPRAQRRVSSEALRDAVYRFAAGLISLGLKKGDRVLLISENRPEWSIADYGTMFAGGIVVPVYVSLTTDQLRFILENSGAGIAIASTQAILDKLVEAARDLPRPEQILVIDQDATAPDAMHFNTVSRLGEERLGKDPDDWRATADALKDDDVATIIYTSGTTGRPKGVMLSHGNLVSNVETLCEALPFDKRDVALSFLPLCHVTQRLSDYCYLNRGVEIVHVPLEDLGHALTSVRPTTFPGVPRVFEKARDSILARAAKKPGPLRALFNWSIETGRQYARQSLSATGPGAWLRIRHALADRLVLRKIRAGLGGRVRYVVAGGAPLHPDVMEFFLAVGLPILEGYGLTETAVLTINRLGESEPGSVGRVLSGVILRIEDDGEILASGPGISRGYYLDIKETEAAFQDGWFRTGDLGRIDESGRLAITGRKKDLIVTSGGKKVAPSLIEQSLQSNRLVAQAVVVGEGQKYVSALVVPDRSLLLQHSRQEGMIAGEDVAYDALLETSRVRSLFKAIIDETNRHLARFEQVKKFALLPEEFTLEGGELTPTLKIKRRVIEEKYGDVIGSLYDGSIQSRET